MRSATEKPRVVAVCRRLKATIGSSRANSFAVSIIAAYIGRHVQAGVDAAGECLGMRKMEGPGQKVNFEVSRGAALVGSSSATRSLRLSSLAFLTLVRTSHWKA